jgi:hypothetical protein
LRPFDVSRYPSNVFESAAITLSLQSTDITERPT